MASVDPATDGKASDERIYYDWSILDADSGASATKLPPAICELLKRLDLDGKGYVDVATLGKFQAIRPSSASVRNTAASMPGKARETRLSPSVLFAFDYDGDGEIASQDLVMANRQMTYIKQQNYYSRKLIFGLLVCMMVLSAAMFGLSFAAAELSKDMYVGTDAVLRTDSGDLALIGVADISVFNGTLVKRGEQVCTADEGCRRLTESTAQPILTGVAQHHKPLSSRIADDVFWNLDKVTVHLTETDCISTAVTLRVHGHMRTRKDGSHCGTIVRLDMLEGTIILDDSDIHMDERLVEHFTRSGLALGEVSSYGRRLQTTSTTVQGIFSHFEELEVRCATDTSPKIHSPTLPYRMTTLEKRPCSGGRCDSHIFAGLKLPGYDEASDSILTITRTLIAEGYSITYESWPNYPRYELVTVVDNVAETTHHYQTRDGEVVLCWNSSFNPPALTNDSDWHVVYIGEATRAATVIEYSGQSYTVPEATNRVFRVRSNHITSEKLIDYEEDSISMMPQRVFFHMAREGELDVEELITLDMKEMDQSDADALRDTSIAPLACLSEEEQENMMVTNPCMEGPFDESVVAVQLIAAAEKTNPESEAREDAYWVYAMEHINDTLIEDDTDTMDNDSRRLLATRQLRSTVCGNQKNPNVFIPFGSSDCVSLTLDRTHGTCIMVATSGSVGKSNSGWSVTGSISAGQCGSSTFRAIGQVEIARSWSIDLGDVFKFSADLYGAIGGQTENFRYTYYTTGSSCPARRLEEDYEEEEEGEVGEETKDVSPSDAPLDDGELLAVAELDQDGVLFTNGTAVMSQDETESATAERRLFWDDRRRRRRDPRRRRNIQCHKWGAKVYGAIGARGSGKILGIGVSVDGQLRLEVGPWPDPPLSSRASVYVTVKACVWMGWTRVCKSWQDRLK